MDAPSLRPWHRLFAFAVASATASLLAVECGGVESQPGVLVLRNGNVLQGAVERLGDYYRVERDGAALSIPAEQVETYCASLQEAYEIRRSRRASSGSDGHVELAAWCLRQDLLDAAARELLDARATDPGNPAIEMIDLQIRQAFQLRQTRAAQPAKQAGLAQAKQAKEAGDGDRPVDAEMRMWFVRSIQPMLIHGCTAGGCHHPDVDQTMPLDRWALDGRGNPSIVRRNLAAVVRQIDFEKPEESSLLVRARHSHGAKGPLSSKPLEVRQIDLLEAWISDVAGVKPPAEESDVQDETGSDDASGEPSADASEDSNDGADAAPRDEFDPAIFTRLKSRP
jgi:hypothetical protein